MKPRALSIGAVLERWVAEFADAGHAKVSAAEHTVTIEFVLPTLDMAYTSPEQLATLREALEVLHIAALVDVGSVEEALAGLCYSSFNEPEDEDEMDAKEEQRSAESAPGSLSSSRQVEFVLTFYGTQGRFLQEYVAPSLFAVNGPRSESYLEARSALLSGHVGPLPPLNCRVNVVSMDGGFDDEIEEDYLQRVVSFISSLDEAVVKTDDANQAEVGDSIPVCVTGISLELNEMAISSETVSAVESLKTTTIPVVCSRVGINPREVTCSAEELSLFLDSVGSRSPKMTVEIGHALMCAPTPSIDVNGSSQEELLQTLFRGIAGARCVTGVSFGPLLTMMSSLDNRKVLWRELFIRLFDEHAMARVSTLVVSPQVELLAEDAVFIEEAVALARPSHLKSVVMWLTQSSPEAVQALVRAVSPCVSATLHSEAHAMTLSQTVDSIVRDCHQLQKLSLTAAVVDSMEVFTRTTAPLREITLTSVALEDTSSLASFLSKVADTTTPLAKNLRKLHIKTENNTVDHLEVDEVNAVIVEKVLASNKVLRDLELSMSENVPTENLAAIQAHNNEVLAEPLVLAQKLAFLSATHPHASKTSRAHRSRVDEDVVRLVFAFAAERVSRHVYLDF